MISEMIKEKVRISKGVAMMIMIVTTVLASSCVTSIQGQKYVSAKADQAKALRAIKRIYLNTDVSNQKQTILSIADFAVNADTNYGALVRAAEILSKFGYHTQVTLDVAEVVSSAPHYHREFYTLVELSVRMLSNSGAIVELTRRFSVAPDEIELERLRRELDQMEAAADYGSVREAYLRQAEWIR